MPAGRRRAVAAVVVLALLLLGLAGSMLLGGSAPESGPGTDATPPPATDASPVAAAPPEEAPAGDAPARGAPVDPAPDPMPPRPEPGTPASEGTTGAAALSKTESVRDQSVAARIVDATTGRPIAGAKIYLSAGPGIEEEFVATTDAQGRFRVEGLPRVIGVRLHVQASGYVSTFAHPLFRTGSSFDLALSPASRVFGRVLDPEGKPVARARVHVERLAAGRGLDRSPELQMESMQRFRDHGFDDARLDEISLRPPRAVTDAAGRFDIDEIPVAQALALMAAANGFSPSEVRRGLVVPPGSAGEEVTLVLQPETTLVLRVGTPAGGDTPASVRATVSTPLGALRMKSDGSGGFLASGLPGGRTWFLVEAPPYAAVFDAVEVPPGTRSEFPVPLGAGEGISGRVEDADGRGVPGIRVAVTPVRKGAAELQLADGAESGSGGDFRLRGLSDGEYVVATEVSTSHYRMEHGTFTAPASGLRLPAPGSLRFRIVMPTGKALPGKDDFEVRHAHENTRYLEAVFHARNLEYDGETGAVRVTKTFPGKTTLSLKVPGCQAVRRQIEIPAGGEVDYGDIALAASFRTTGRVLDHEGKPVQGAEVQAWYPSRDTSRAISGPEGTFELLDLAPGPVTVEVNDAANDPEKFALRTWKWNFFADMAPLELRLTPGGAIRVRVLDASGVPVTVAHVVCEPEGEKPYRAVPRAVIATGEPGEYAGRRQPGPMTIQVLDPQRPYRDGVLGSAKATIRDGAEAFVEIRLKK